MFKLLLMLKMPAPRDQIADVLELTGGESATHVEIFDNGESKPEAAIVKAVPVVENTPVLRVNLMQFRVKKSSFILLSFLYCFDNYDFVHFEHRYNALNAKAALNGRTLFGLNMTVSLEAKLKL